MGNICNSPPKEVAGTKGPETRLTAPQSSQKVISKAPKFPDSDNIKPQGMKEYIKELETWFQ